MTNEACNRYQTVPAKAAVPGVTIARNWPRKQKRGLPQWNKLLLHGLLLLSQVQVFAKDRRAGKALRRPLPHIGERVLWNEVNLSRADRAARTCRSDTL